MYKPYMKCLKTLTECLENNLIKNSTQTLRYIWEVLMVKSPHGEISLRHRLLTWQNKNAQRRTVLKRKVLDPFFSVWHKSYYFKEVTWICIKLCFLEIPPLLTDTQGSNRHLCRGFLVGWIRKFKMPKKSIEETRGL